MKTSGRFRPALFALLASSLLAAGLAEARPRIIWTIPSLTAAEPGVGKTIFLGTDGVGTATDVPNSLILTADRDTGKQTEFLRRNGFTIGSNVAFRPLTYSIETKTLFATFADPARLTAISSKGRALWDVGVLTTGFIGEIALTKEGNIVVPALGGGVSHLNRNNGKTNWRRADLNVLPPDAPAIGSGGVVFVHAATIVNGASRNATLVALDARNGNTIWSTLSGLAAPTSEPVVTSKGLVIVSGDGILAFKASNGAQVWNRGAGSFGKPVIAGTYAVVASNRQLAGLSLTNGKVKWVRSIPVATSEPVLTANGLVLIGTGNAVQAFDPKSGRRKWRVVTPGIVRAVSVNGNRYFCALSNTDSGRISQLVGIQN